MSDTIAAISTAHGTGAISIIRISGEDAILVASDLMHKDLAQKPGYTMQYGSIYVGDEPVDEVLTTVFHAPHSYTGEDMVEINCHGGLYITNKVLSIVLSQGVRMADRGEFTRRAYLNNKMSLSQAEGISDLIFARNELNAKSSMHAMKGSVQRLIDPLEEELIQLISNIEANIDYPEYYDIHEVTEKEVLPKARKWLSQVDTIIDKADQALTVREGINTVILGRPNVGKSSLLNALLEENKAIVTNIAGTTRDLVEGDVMVAGIPLHLIDTAGIRETSDTIEQIGVERSLEAAKKASLIILVLDAENPDTPEDLYLLDQTKEQNRIVVYNKKDRKKILGKLCISAMNNDIDSLKDAIAHKYEQGLNAAQSDTLNNTRQIGCLRRARKSMQDAVNSLEAGMELDLITIDLQDCWYALKEINGSVTKEDMLDEVFSRFCLGK